MRSSGVFLVLLLSIAVSVGLGQNQPFRNAPPELEKALKERITEFYTLFQQGKFRQAEALVAEESRDAFYGMNKARNMGFEIQTMEFSPDLKSAEALVALMMVMPMMGKEPLPFPVHTRWKWIGDNWYIYFPEHKPGETIDTPFGPKKLREQDSSGYVFPESEERPTAKTLKNMYEVSARELKFPSSCPEPITRTISVTNDSKGRLSVKSVSNSLKGLDLKIEPAEAEPGEDITISFTYQPAENQLRRKYRSTFFVSPISQRFVVNLIFEEREVRYEPTAGKVYAEDLKVSDQGKQTLEVSGLTPGQLYRIAARGHALEGGQGKLFLVVNDDSRRTGSADGPRMVPGGKSDFFAVDFTPSESGRARIHLGYDGGPGWARWSGLTITPRRPATLSVPNGGFERVFLQPWQQWGEVVAERSSEVVRSGRSAAKLSGSDGLIFLDVAGVSPGSRYEVKAWARSAPGTEGKAGLEAHDGQGNGAVYSEKKIISESEFEPLAIEFVGTDSGKLRIHLAYSGGPGAVYFDDVVVSEKSVPNGGFENESLDPWEVSGKADVKIENEISATGSNSLSLNGNGAVVQALTGLRSGAAYQLTAWARAADPEVQALLKVSGEQSADQRHPQDGPRAASDSFFVPFSVDFVADPQGSARVQLENAGGSGTVYWDDVTVTPRSASANDQAE